MKPNLKTQLYIGCASILTACFLSSNAINIFESLAYVVKHNWYWKTKGDFKNIELYGEKQKQNMSLSCIN